MIELVSLEDVFSATEDEVNEILGGKEPVKGPHAHLLLAKEYGKAGMLSARDSLVVGDEGFAKAWLSKDEDLARLVNDKLPLTRFEASIVASKLYRTLVSDIVFPSRITHVFVEPSLKLKESTLTSLRVPSVSLTHSLPEFVPDGKDIIILVRGRPLEVLQKVREARGTSKFSSSITGNDALRIISVIESHGSYAKIVAVNDYERPIDEWLVGITIVAGSEEDAVRYVKASYDPTAEGLTYHVSGSGESSSIETHVLLRSWRLVYKHSIGTYVDYVRTHNTRDERIIEGGRDSSLWHVRSSLLSTVESLSLDIFSKRNLYDYMRSVYSDADEFVPKTSPLAVSDTYEGMSLSHGEVCIVKPSGSTACSGRGMTVVSSQSELEAAWNKIRDVGNVCVIDEKGEVCFGENKKIKWTLSVSSYINNPLLYDGRKMHLRAYMLATTWGKTSWFKMFEVFLAHEKYEKGNYLNARIHDTHSSGTNVYVIYPDDFEESLVSKLEPSVNLVMERLSSSLRSKSWCYGETKFSYEILAVDMLPTDDYKCWILEVNTFPDTFVPRFPAKKFKTFQDGLSAWINKTVIEPVANLLTGVRLVPLEASSVTMRNALSQITNKSHIMSNVGNGRLWSANDIENMYKASVREAGTSQRRYFQWLITNNDVAVGFVELKGTNVAEELKGTNVAEELKGTNVAVGKDDLYVRIFVGEQRKGFGRRALSLLNYEEPSRKVYAVVSNTNYQSLNLFRGMYSVFKKDVIAYGKLSTVFVRNR